MSRFFITYILFMCFCSCEKQNEKSYCVTYHVSCFGEVPGKMLISYKDTTGYVFFSTSEKIWSQDVCLSFDDLASLFVIFQPAPDLKNENLLLPDFYREENKVVIHGKIIHPKKTVCGYNSNVVLVDLFPE